MVRNNRGDPTLPGLISHLQTIAEREKADLARELHDELGGMLVAASMDLAWLERHLGPAAGDVQRRLGRMREALGGAVDLKRKIIEELRPTLLDNVGLFAALKWLTAGVCARAAIECTLEFPEAEPPFTPEAAIGLFRITQEALALITKSASVREMSLRIARLGPRVSLDIVARGSPGSSAGVIGRGYDLATIRHRTRVLGGDLSIEHAGTQLRLSARLPLASLV